MEDINRCRSRAAKGERVGVSLWRTRGRVTSRDIQFK